MPHIPEVAGRLSAIHAIEAIERADAKTIPPHATTFPAVS